MLSTLIVLSSIFMLIPMLLKLENSVKLSLLGIATFLSIGGTYMAYQENEGYYAYVPLSFAIVSIIYTIYVAYISLSNQKDWGDEVNDSCLKTEA